jgi:hypothetical protein
MIGAYNKTGLDQLPPLLNYTPWPWWQEAETPWLAEKRQVLKVIKCVPPAEAAARGAGDGPGHVGRLAATPQGRVALARSLSAMRQQIIPETGARVVLGGKPDNFMGAMPGIVEEALLAIRARQPLFILGAFGGAARLVADAIRGRKPEGLTLAYQTRSSPPYAAMLEGYEREAAPPADQTGRLHHDHEGARGLWVGGAQRQWADAGRKPGAARHDHRGPRAVSHHERVGSGSPQRVGEVVSPQSFASVLKLFSR